MQLLFQEPYDWRRQVDGMSIIGDTAGLFGDETLDQIISLTRGSENGLRIWPASSMAALAALKFIKPKSAGRGQEAAKVAAACVLSQAVASGNFQWWRTREEIARLFLGHEEEEDDYDFEAGEELERVREPVLDMAVRYPACGLEIVRAIVSEAGEGFTSDPWRLDAVGKRRLVQALMMLDTLLQSGSWYSATEGARSAGAGHISRAIAAYAPRIIAAAMPPEAAGGANDSARRCAAMKLLTTLATPQLDVVPAKFDENISRYHGDYMIWKKFMREQEVGVTSMLRKAVDVHADARARDAADTDAAIEAVRVAFKDVDALRLLEPLVAPSQDAENLDLQHSALGLATVMGDALGGPHALEPNGGVDVTAQVVYRRYLDCGSSDMFKKSPEEPGQRIREVRLSPLAR